MGKGNDWLRHLAEGADFFDENITREPLLELCGNNRVLIEHHCGVMEYGPNQIRIKIKNGDFAIVGMNLRLCQMCADKLMIRGKIQEIHVRKGRN